jgi:hypothetical protein
MHLMTQKLYISDASRELFPKVSVPPVSNLGVKDGGYCVPPAWEYLKFSGDLLPNPLQTGDMILFLTVTDRRV